MRGPELESYCSLADGWNVTLVEGAEALAFARRDIVPDAYVCALDAEWDCTAAPCAALVQLAFRLRSGGREVLLLDLLKLPTHEAHSFLGDVFRNRDVLKVGYAFVGDLRAIDAALGGVASVQPAVDLASLHRVLAVRGLAALPPAGQRGLAGLVHAQLGCTLDKQLQCSAWAERPLSAAQVRYAALDAAILLDLLDAFAAAAPPHRHPLACLTPAAAKPRLVERGRDALADAEQRGGETGPVEVPWAPGDAPRFVCDANLEGLARQLRMCGLDATSTPSGGPHTQRFLVHRWLVDAAEREARLVLTTDKAFVAMRYTRACFLVAAPDKKAQLAQVLAALGIAVPEGRLLSRCAACNGEFGPRPLRPDEVADSGVPLPGSFTALQPAERRRTLRLQLQALSAKGFGKPSVAVKEVTKNKPHWEVERDLCPCSSDRKYADCCAPYLKSKAVAPTPEVVMRSRFTAYVKQVPQYIVDTTHPENPAFGGSANPDGSPSSSLLEDADATCRKVAFRRLNIVRAHAPELDASEAWVTFQAWYRVVGQLGQARKGGPKEKRMDEVSRFLRSPDGRWLYHGGEVAVNGAHKADGEWAEPSS
ncbi:hypothetical protein WJX81_006883 [Elliptochloris bilobata]|uniref:3'-5' exonuclease domain-containing protein n=1 Tax=Elliptochloris bilobata TaxID=381761 RepID=A0AAW1SHD9_9CHLO